jgi:hypothetical protein
MPVTEATPNTLAQIVAVQLRQAGHEIPADIVDQLETYVLEAYETLKLDAGYDPEDYAVAQARVAARHYATYQFMALGTKTAPFAASASRLWEMERRKWRLAAAKEYHYAQQNPE